MGRLNSFPGKCACCGEVVQKYAGFIYQDEQRTWLVYHKTCDPNIVKPEPFDHPDSIQTPIEDSQMTTKTTKTTKLFERRTFINGIDASTLTDDAIFDVLGVAGAEVARLEAVTIRPAKLNRKIDKLTVAIEKVGRYVDNR